jgi:2-haloacid dehalogenase
MYMAPPTKVCVFDAYGTLFDLHSAASRHAAAVGALAAPLSQLWRNKQVEYSWIRSGMAPPSDGWRDFWQLTTDALAFAMASLGLDDARLRDSLLDAYMTLDAFPDASGALQRLKQSGMSTAILSNGTPAMLRAALASSGLDGLVDVVASADEVKTFKPSPRLYQLIPEKFGVSPGDVLFHSSNAWDAASAASFGFRVVWINRTRQPREYAFAAMAAELTDLSAVPAFVDGAA